MYKNNKRLIILDADGTTIDAYSAIDKTFSRHGMEIGDEERFQKRRRLFKYLGGLKEFPSNLKKQIGKQNRKLLIATLTEVYREEALLYPGIAGLVQSLIAAPDVVVGLVTRNVTNQPEETLRQLFRRHDIDLNALDFFAHIPTHQEKSRNSAQSANASTSIRHAPISAATNTRIICRRSVAACILSWCLTALKVTSD
nr:hypothetical protein [Collimonas arenae]